MQEISIDAMLEAGVHFGHQTQRWNPKMKKFIFTARNGIYIIDLKKTLKNMEEACNAVGSIVAKGKRIMFVGTKKQAKVIIRQEAERSGEYFIVERWLGGMLTNFQTIRKNLEKLYKIEDMFENGSINRLAKKEILNYSRERDKMINILGGIRGMKDLPGALFVIDPKNEKIAVAEANRLNIPVIAIIDTNCDPDPIDYPIPANDDAIRSIALISRQISTSILEAKAVNKEGSDADEFQPVEVKPAEAPAEAAGN
ncbi:MAG: 30S ribosomal protein S2 [Candidatus Delongbacteria bacterium]|nr:30S ribosomal protein S2 [Candidatus Delongbacteria bacterium]